MFGLFAYLRGNLYGNGGGINGNCNVNFQQAKRMEARKEYVADGINREREPGGTAQ